MIRKLKKIQNNAAPTRTKLTISKAKSNQKINKKQ